MCQLSHDLKNPISAILMSTDLLVASDGDLNRRAIRIIKRNSQNMLGLIDSILTNGVAQAGHLKLNIQICPVRDIIANVLGSRFYFKLPDPKLKYETISDYRAPESPAYNNVPPRNSPIT
jgi:signal transduction histidine kinase